MTAQNYQRKQPRLLVNRPGRIRIGNGPEERSQLVDISQSGALLLCSQPMEVGTAFELRFSLSSGSRTKCLVYGYVRRYSVRGTSHVVGVEFSHFEPETYEAIRQFVEQKAEAVA